MRLSSLLDRLSYVFLPVAAICTIYLYLYPFWHQCGFPTVSDSHEVAPFRLLTLGDPQLEGSTSLPNPDDPLFPSLTELYSDGAELFRSLSGTYESSNLATDIPFIFASALDNFKAFWRKDLLKWLGTGRKKIDLWGNDLYLRHIFQTMKWWTEPTHIVVLGDLLGSQWIDDEEFDKRQNRFWNVVFDGGVKTSTPEIQDDYLDEDQKRDTSDIWVEQLGQNSDWENRIICIAGNHDVGYAGDINDSRMRRFETAFGKANWDVRFQLPFNSSADSSMLQPPELRLLILNSMNVDTPAYDSFLQKDTYDFLNAAIAHGRPVEDPTAATILLTHVPLFKPEGVCVDAPYFTYFSDGGGVREQNHISPTNSRGIILEGIFGLGRGGVQNGIVLNGHDHEGCDTWHRILSPDEASERAEAAKKQEALEPMDENVESTTAPSETVMVEDNEAGDTGSGQDIEDQEEEDIEEERNDEEADAEEHRPDYNVVEPDEQRNRWESVHYRDALTHHLPERTDSPGLREVTVRSMMGDFGGNAGLVSAWFNQEAKQWRFEYSTCSSGVQHIWWAVHVIDLIAALVLISAVLARLAEAIVASQLPAATGKAAFVKAGEVSEPKKPAVQRNGVVKASGADSRGSLRERKPP